MTTEKQTYRSGPYKSLYAQGVKSGNTLYIAGQVGVDPSGKPGADIIEQTRLAYQNIQHVLEQFSASASDIVDETWFITDMKGCMKNSDAVFAARAEFFGLQPDVAQTLVEVGALVMPQLQIEIKCIAHIG